MSQPLDREETLFAEALMLPVAARAEFLARACAGDEELRARVAALLVIHEQPGDLLNAPPEAELGEAARAVRHELLAEESPGGSIGRYTLIEKLGEGGCGVVYLAEQTEPVRRRVALKVIKLGMDTREVIARFAAERQALALMDHANIARVYDAGATAGGRPYFVMEFVPGTTLTKFCDEHQLTPAARIALFIAVCHAVQHAHQKGVIHRDLKPSNILVSLRDGVATPKVIDFGIAKATEGRLTERTFATAFEHFIGTPAYMSPEQAGLGRLDIDTRSDVYSLGVLLYELLTGRTPFDAKELQRAAVEEIRRRIREVDPPWPSTLLATLDHATISSAAHSRQLTPPDLAKLLRGDLDWIVMRCLEKDRTRRYETANGLAMDLQRHLAHEPVVARPPGRVYLLGKFVRRHRFGFAAAAAIGVAVLLGLVVSSWEALRANRAEKLADDRLRSETAARREAERQRTEAERERAHALAAGEDARREAATSAAISDFLRNDVLAQASPNHQPDRDLRLRTVVDTAAKKIDGHFPSQPLVEAAIRDTLGGTYSSLGEYALAEQHFAHVLRLRQQNLPPDHEEILAAMNKLVNALRQQTKFAEAEHYALVALDRQRRVLGPEHPLTLNAMASQGASYLQQGRLEAGEKLLVETVAGMKRGLGPEHPDTLRAMGTLASAHALRGHLAESEALHRQVYEIRRRVLGPDNPQTLASMENIGNALSRRGDYEGAEAQFTAVFATRRRVQGPEHPQTLTTALNLGIAELKLEKFSAAEARLAGTLALLEKKSGAENALTLHALHNLASARLRLGQLAEAEALMKKCLEIRDRKLGADHPDTLDSGNGLAWIELAQNHPAEAAARFTQIASARQRVLGADHPETQETLFGWASAEVALGKLPEAESRLRTILTTCQRVVGHEHTTTLQTADELAGVLLKQRAFAEAETLLRANLTIRRKSGASHWRTYSNESDLGAALAGQEKFADAEPLLLGAWAGLQGQLAQVPATHRASVRGVAERLSSLCAATRRPDEAARWREKALAANAQP